MDCKVTYTVSKYGFIYSCIQFYICVFIIRRSIKHLRLKAMPKEIHFLASKPSIPPADTTGYQNLSSLPLFFQHC